MNKFLMLSMLLISACSINTQKPKWKKYTCDNSYKLNAKFEEDQVQWSLATKNMILDMVPFKAIGDGKYQNNTSIIQKKEDGSVLITTKKINTICR